MSDENDRSHDRRTLADPALNPYVIPRDTAERETRRMGTPVPVKEPVDEQKKEKV